MLIAIDTTVDLKVLEKWPMVFGAGAAGARGFLTAIASSMITVAGVVFSITTVALSLTASQYTSRVLRNFIRDRVNQTVLGVFMGSFAYCLVVLRTIRAGDEGGFVPPLAVLGGLVLAFVGIGFLIYFIHHIATSVQASSIIANAARETITAIDVLYPKMLSAATRVPTISDFGDQSSWFSVVARETGYIESVDDEQLAALAKQYETTLRMERGVGEFVVEGTVLLWAATDVGLDHEAVASINAAYVVGRHRTVQQDVGFGIRQIVDIAMKALSPGINDTTTAIVCVDYLSAILVRLAPREILLPHHFDQGTIRLIARGLNFESLLKKACEQIRQNATNNIAVLQRQIESLEVIAAQTHDAGRLQAIIGQKSMTLGLLQRALMAAELGVSISSS